MDFYLDNVEDLKRVWKHITKTLTIKDFEKVKKEIQKSFPMMTEEKAINGFVINQLITKITGGGTVELLLRIEHDFSKFLGLTHETQLEELEKKHFYNNIPPLFTKRSMDDEPIFDRYDIRDFLRETLDGVNDTTRSRVMKEFQKWINDHNDTSLRESLGVKLKIK